MLTALLVAFLTLVLSVFVEGACMFMCVGVCWSEDNLPESILSSLSTMWALGLNPGVRLGSKCLAHQALSLDLVLFLEIKSHFCSPGWL